MPKLCDGLIKNDGMHTQVILVLMVEIGMLMIYGHLPKNLYEAEIRPILKILNYEHDDHI